MVTAGGIDTGRLQQRRQVASSSASHGSGLERVNSSLRGHLDEVADGDEYDEDEDVEEDWKKDA